MTRVTAALTALAGVLALLGWTTGQLLLARFSTGWPVMSPIGASALVLAGTALWLLSDNSARRSSRIIGISSAVLVGAIGVQALVEYVAGVDLGTDRLLFPDLLGTLNETHPGRPSPYTALALLTAAIALLTLNADRKSAFGTAASAVSAAVTLSAVIAYLYGSTWLRGLSTAPGMALSTGLALLALNIGILCARPDRTPVSLFTLTGTGGVLARRLLPPILVVPVLAGIAGDAQVSGYFVDPAIGWSLGVTATVAVLLTVVGISLRTVRRAEALAEAAAAELTRTEREARWQAELLSAVLNGISDGVVVVDDHGKMLLENPAASVLLGGSAAGVAVDAWPEHFGISRPGASEVLSVGELPLVRAMRGDDGGGDIEITIRDAARPEGIIVAMNAAPLAGSGRQRGAVAMLHDITERRRIKAKFRGLLETAPGAIIGVNTDGRILFVNAQAEQLFGYRRRDEMLGQPVEMLLPEAARSVHVAKRDEFLRHPVQRPMGVGLDLAGRRRDGSHFPIEVSLSAMDSDEGQIVLAAVTDITDRRLIERKVAELNVELLTLNEGLEHRVSQRTSELQEQTETLIRVNDELEAFSYSVSHDLRAPLRTVGGFATLLTERYGDQLDDDGNRYLGKIRDGGQRMGQLIDGLLAFSRLQRQDLAVTPVDMAALVRDVWDQLAQSRTDRTIQFTVGQLPNCVGDGRMLWHVLTNLLDNAIKYTRHRDDAEVQVGCDEDDAGRNVYYVRDNGTGFDMRYVDKLFKVFQRLHRAEDFEGTGIGLALAARVIHRHGGDIWAEGKPALGATFYFTVPPEGGSA